MLIQSLHLTLQCQDSISTQRSCRHHLQPVQLMTLQEKMHAQGGQARTQQLQCTWWQSSAEPSPVHHAEDLLHALGLPASAHACYQMLHSMHRRVLTVCSSFGLHGVHAALHRVPVLPLIARCAHQQESFDGIKVGSCIDVCSCMTLVP
jgi:hypothetical protein